jgi:hypothetical protein
MHHRSLVDRVLDFYRRMNREGAAALAELPELFTEDVSFDSPIEATASLEELREAWQHAFSIYERFEFNDLRSVGNDDTFAIFYTMRITLKVGQSLGARPIDAPTATLCFGRNGKVHKQVDYWDTVGSLATVTPETAAAYRSLMELLFGTSFASGRDGCAHPSTEEELRRLVRESHDAGGTLRVVGSGHSVWESIVPSGFVTQPKAGAGGPRLVMLDRYRAVRRFYEDPKQPGRTLVEVEAGIHLGESPRLALANPLSSTSRVGDPSVTNVTRDTSWKESLCFALQSRGLALPDLGGISHQTVSGFLSTGSAGGTVRYSIRDAIHSLRVIDGEGEVHEVSPDTDADWFAAAGLGLGLVGVISTVTLRCEPTYDVVGVETTSTTRGAPDVNFYGVQGDPRPTLAKFLIDQPYTRLMWWPQAGFDRLVVWKAERQAPVPESPASALCAGASSSQTPHSPPAPGFQPKPYAELGRGTQVAASLLYTLLGNLGPEGEAAVSAQVERVRRSPLRDRIARKGEEVLSALAAAGPPAGEGALAAEIAAFEETHPWLKELMSAGGTSSAAWDRLVESLSAVLDAAVTGALHSEKLAEVVAILRKAAPYVLPLILDPFVPLGANGAPTVKTFQDVWYRALPMDNGMDDLLMPVFFTEIWVPFTSEGGEVQEVVDRLARMFAAGGDRVKSYEATGAFCVELYAVGGSKRFFLDPAWGDQPLFRVDVFWFGHNAGDPVRDFYPQFWDALDGLDARLHWGKFLQPPPKLQRLPMAAQFEAVRQRVDPRGVFLTDYWRAHLGIDQ